MIMIECAESPLQSAGTLRIGHVALKSETFNVIFLNLDIGYEVIIVSNAEDTSKIFGGA